MLVNWFYYHHITALYSFGLIFVIGAEINAFFFDDIQTVSMGLGTCLSEYADREQIQLMDDHDLPTRSMSTLEK